MLYHVILTSIPLFASVDHDRLAEIARHSPVRQVEVGAVVAAYGMPADHLLVVESGTLTAYRETRQGKRLRLGDHPAPCAVDKIAVLGRRGHTATWIAATRCQLRRIPYATLVTLIDELSAVRHHVINQLAGMLCDRQDELLGLAYADAPRGSPRG